MTASRHFRRTLALLGCMCLAAAPVAPQAAARQSAPPPQQNQSDTLSGAAAKILLAGEKAQKAGDWQSAYNDYLQVAGAAPRNKEAVFLMETARFHLVQEHADAAERDLLAGNQDQAENELRTAIEIDPSYAVARERLAQIQKLNLPQQNPKQAPLPQPVAIRAQRGARDFDFHGDPQAIFREIARQFGVAADFDPDMRPGRNIHFRLAAADFDLAMKVAADETHTFWVSRTDKEFLVADDSPIKRRQFEPLTVRTFVFPESETEAQMTEETRAVREIAGVQRTSLNAATRELTLRDNSQNIAIADQLLQQMEQGRGEMVLEIELLEVDKDAMTGLGIATPTSASVVPLTSAEIAAVQNASTPQALLSVIQNIFGTTAGGGALGGLLPPLVAFGGGSSIFFSTLANTQANFSQTYSFVHSAQRILLRARDNQIATFFVGDHYPVTLSLLSSNLATTALTEGSLLQNTLAAGTAPSAVITTSLRGNGIADLIATNQGDNNVSVFLGNGDGTFAARTNTNVGNGPVALVTGDFNGDGKPDLAVVNQTDNTISILLGNGDGTFTPGVTLTTGKSPSAIVAADFNGDGFLDLAVTNQDDNTATIFLGDGTGNFTTSATLTTGTAPAAIATADFNADSRLDLAIANSADSTISIFLGNGDGTFTSKSGYATGTTPVSIAIADFNGDGRPDLAVANEGANTFSIFPGNGDGTFGARVDFQTGVEPDAILTGDFNGDGIPDLITANRSDNTITVFLGTGQATFSSQLTINVGAGPVSLAAADFNGDSLLDLAVADQTGNAISTILNSASLNSIAQIPQTPYPGSQYEDIGLKVKATPRVHANGEVTLTLSFEISALSGTDINGIPIINNEQIDQVIRVRENQTTLLTSLVNRQQTNSINGWPGFAQIPGAGDAFGTQNLNNTDTELLFIITPRMVRSGPHSGPMIFAGPGGGGGVITGTRPGGQ